MSDTSIRTNSLQSLLGTKDFFTSQGDLIAVAEALYAATAEQVNKVTRSLVVAAQNRLLQLAKLNEIGKQLDSLASVDTKTLALGVDQATSDALVADLDAASVSLTTGESYYIASQSYNKDGTLLGAQGSHIANASEKTTAEAGTLVGTPDAEGNEIRKVMNADGAYTLYSLLKSDTVLTASATDVATALDTIALTTAPLLETVATDILRIKAFLTEHPPQRADGRFGEARSEESKKLDARQAEYVSLAEVAMRRTLQWRYENTAPLPTEK